MKIKNQKLKIKNSFFLILFFAILLLPLVSLATHGDRLVPCGPGTGTSCQFCHFFVLFQNVINFLLIHIVPVVAVLMIVIGGFMYVFAHFSPGELLPGGQKGGPVLLVQARKLFASVIIGLIIIYASWLIINLFFQAIRVNTWTGLIDNPATPEVEGWWRIDCPL